MTPAGARRFPWRALLLCWLVIAFALAAGFRAQIAEGSFTDPDDQMRLLQVRDLIAGQSWFDLTQHRINPPEGLAMHWSRLADLPILAVLLPLRALVSPPLAEQITLVVVPMLTLLALMIATTLLVRRLFGPGREFTLVAPLLLLSAPIVVVQFFPMRIDHHGWQMVSAACALVALLDRAPWRSGLTAGLALAAYMAISIEGLPFVAAAAASAGLLWALDIDRSRRFEFLMASLAVAALGCFALASPGDWRSLACDALAPGHVVALGVAAFGVSFAVRATTQASPAVRLAALSAVAMLCAATFLGVAPQCVGSPFGTMDPVVARFWYQNVSEGLPVWRQTFPAAVGMTAFPLVGCIGTFFVVRTARSAETRRRWLLVLLICIAACLTGLLVRRTAGVAHIAALPGAFAIMLWLRGWISARVRPALQPVAGAVALVGLSPVMPVSAAAAMADAGSPPPLPAVAVKPVQCDVYCALDRLAKMPRMTILTAIDAGPHIVGRTPHSVHASGYHRLQAPMRTTIDVFTAEPAVAEHRMRATGLRYLLIAPDASEATVFADLAPKGLMTALAAGRTPRWLEPVDLGSPELKLYRVRP
ncbi:MAG: hypothetical protein ACKVOP_10350 [Sphingomonadaceae bacterium]